MQHLFLDCSHGMSGDMTLASLAHLGVDLSPLPGLLAQAGVACRLEVWQEERGGGPGCRVEVSWEVEGQPLRHPADIAAIFAAVPVSNRVRHKALAVLEALTLAEALDGEVINADSRQVYSDFPLITAQPSPEEQACCPHHLYGFLPTEQKISAGRWADQAVAEAKAVLARSHVPLLVGGTGLYFQGLLHGIAEIPAIDPAITAALTARLAEEGPAALHAELAAKDPAYAARIHPNDRQRIVRALEVLAGTGHTFSWWHEHGMPEPPCAGPLLVLDMELDALTPRLARRIDLMLEQGALDEARAARRRCDDAAAPGWSGIGCAEVLAHLRGELSLEECRRLWLHNTRAYAKRQRTWFRARSEARFFAPQDLDGLIGLLGSKERFTEKLDSMFTYAPDAKEDLPIFSTGMIGQYAHGNEPSHHVIYLYNKVGQPWKTQKYVAQVLHDLYLNAPDGICGNEDCGQMSAWFVFSAMGFYPVDPVGGQYEIGTPLFPEVKMHLADGKVFKILAPGVNAENIYIQSVKLNGQPYDKSYITHDQIMSGATLEFEMGNQPGQVWYKD